MFDEPKAYAIAKKIKPLVSLLIHKQTESDIVYEAEPLGRFDAHDNLTNETLAWQQEVEVIDRKIAKINEILADLIEFGSEEYDLKNR